jgi:hypothetical protein
VVGVRNPHPPSWELAFEEAQQAGYRGMCGLRILVRSTGATIGRTYHV